MYINEPRLSDFKQVLNKAGIQAEFAGGVLICNNVVAVRRVRKRFSLILFKFKLTVERFEGVLLSVILQVLPLRTTG